MQEKPPAPTANIKIPAAPSCLDTAEACGRLCLMDGPCEFLERGLTAAALREQVATLSQQAEQHAAERQQWQTDKERLVTENTRLAGAVDFLMWDPLMDGFLTRGGAELTLREPSELKTRLEEELASGRVGLVTLDIRGMNFVNNSPSGSHAAGNILLQIAGQHIREHVRSCRKAYEGEDRRKDDSPAADTLFVRQGGDELSLIMHDVSGEDFTKRLNELRDSLSMERSLAADNPYHFPLIASVGGAHASKMMLPATWSESDRAVADAVQMLLHSADAEARILRQEQYDRLWLAACGTRPDLRQRYPQQPDDTIVAKNFFATHFPYFVVHVTEVLRQAQNEIEACLLSAALPHDDETHLQ